MKFALPVLICLLAVSRVWGQSEDIFRQIYIGSTNAVIQLVEQDPYNVHAREWLTRRTPLMVAADAGKKELVAYFLSQGAEVNATDSSGNTALRWAALTGHNEIAVLLLENGAKPEIFSAVVLGRTNEVAALIKQDPRFADPPVRDIPSPLMLASRNDHLEVMRQLLAAGAHPSPRNKENQPLIIEAAGRDRPDQVALLLEHGVAVDTRSGKNETALLIAAEKASAPLVKLLLEKGAQPILKDWRGWQPLHAAVFGNRIENVRLLVDQPGVDVNAPCDEGTPLHMAIWKHGNPEIARLLLEHQADVTARDRRQKTPLQLARSYRREAIIALLQEFGAVQ